MTHLDFSRTTILQFVDGSCAIEITNLDGSATLIDGFPGPTEAKDFLHFGDWEDEGITNDFVQVIQPNYPLVWSHDRVN